MPIIIAIIIVLLSAHYSQNYVCILICQGLVIGVLGGAPALSTINGLLVTVLLLAALIVA